MRGVGLIFCLFVLMVFSGNEKGIEGFHKNILIALWASLLIIPVFLWILWRYSALQVVNRRYLAGDAEDPAWERRMNVTFSLLLSFIVVVALLLASMGYHPK